mmetsp:Transcript_17445/g.60290  ORF Transcript_17445/g.60290 Transcript_17445/m.60290 type:complete len:112 (+) Transcript_17445:1815-2150(+)
MPVHHIQEVQALESHSNRRPMSTIYQQIRFNSPKDYVKHVKPKFACHPIQSRINPPKGKHRYIIALRLQRAPHRLCIETRPRPNQKNRCNQDLLQQYTLRQITLQTRKSVP